MKKLVLLTSCLITAVLANAQSPTFKWAKGMGGTLNDFGSSVRIDGSGNVYSTGGFGGTVDFDPGAGTFNLTATAGFNTFILKLDASGNFVWAKSIGGNSRGVSLALDASGNIYTTGFIDGTADFDPGTGTFNLTSASSDIFILKLNSSGNFVWAKLIGGTSYDVVASMALDASGNVYTCGAFAGVVDFDPGSGIFNLTSIGTIDIFISKLDASGNFVWAKGIGAALGDNRGSNISVNAAGNVIATGSFKGTVDSDPGAGVFNLTSAGMSDILILKLSSAGDFVWAKQIGGTLNDAGKAITDGTGNIYTIGNFSDIVDFDPGSSTFNLTSAGGIDAFISKFDASGNFVWAKRMGGTLDDGGVSIALDASGNIYTTGLFKGTVDFDPGTSSFNLTSVGDYDIFISKLDASGNFVWATCFGGTLSDNANSIALDVSGNILSTGYFNGTADFDPSGGIFNLTSAGSYDIFLSKMSQTTGGILENDAASNITIYPNPTNGMLNVECSMLNSGELKLQVLNSMGQIVLEENAIQHSQFTVQHLPDGLYLVKVLNNNTLVATQKIIKK